ncbi:MAG: hypothetical protein QXL22_01070 [Candidatus Nezhaarchaeales archaeon]
MAQEPTVERKVPPIYEERRRFIPPGTILTPPVIERRPFISPIERPVTVFPRLLPLPPAEARKITVEKIPAEVAHELESIDKELRELQKRIAELLKRRREILEKTHAPAQPPVTPPRPEIIHPPTPPAVERRPIRQVKPPEKVIRALRITY